MLIMNGDFYNNLPDDLKKIIDEAGNEGMIAAAKSIELKNIAFY